MQRLKDAPLDRRGFFDRQLRGIDGGRSILDLRRHGEGGRMCDVSHDANYYFQPLTVWRKNSLSSNRGTPFSASLSVCVSRCGREDGVLVSMVEVQCNLMCDLNQRPKDLNHDPGALLICDLVTSVEFVAVVVATGRDDDLAVHFVDLVPLRCRKCDVDID